MDGGQLAASLLSDVVEPLTVLPASALVVLPSRAGDAPGTGGGSVYARLTEHPGEHQLVDAVHYIDLSKAHLSTGLEPPAPSDHHQKTVASGGGGGAVLLRDQYVRWRALRQRLRLADDSQLARLLMNAYETSEQTEQLLKTDTESPRHKYERMEEECGLPEDGDEDREDRENGEEDREDGEDREDTVRVMHCEISDTTPAAARAAAGTVQQDTCLAVGAPRHPCLPGETRVPEVILPHFHPRVVPRRDRPCPRSRKPPGWYQPLPPPPGADDEEEDDSDSETGAESPVKLFTFPPVEPQLLSYFSCGLCDESGFPGVQVYFDHLWQQHTELHMVGDRIQRVPIRLRPQLFVICALCGLNNKGSNGYCQMYLTRQHMPHHAELVTGDWSATELHCDGCREVFHERGALALHALDAEHANPAHRCPAPGCGHELEGAANYIAHLRRHYLSRPFQCYFCMQMFVTEAGCIAHIKRHHAADYSVHKCTGCGYVTALFHDFLLHIRSHSQLNAHVCHVCGVVFVSKMSLKHHIRTHSDSQFPCDQCGKVFSHPQTRRRHVLNAHQRPDKCTCPVCGRQFGSAYSMKRHYMIHTGERPYQCDKCGRGFVQKGDLQSHYKRCKFTETTNVSLFL